MRRTANNKFVWPNWWTFWFGGLSRLPMRQGGGYMWRPNLYRYIRKFYREGWNDDYYTLRSWINRRMING